MEKCILDFGKTMQEKLDRHGRKTGDVGWKDCDLSWLLLRLRKETIELEEAINAGNLSDIMEESADVGNFAMMIHDITLEEWTKPTPDFG